MIDVNCSFGEFKAMGIENARKNISKKIVIYPINTQAMQMLQSTTDHHGLSESRSVQSMSRSLSM